VNVDELLNWLDNTLDHQAKSPAHFITAITHRSFSKTHNERLEFLGDALLDLIIGEALFHQLPNEDEGKLSRFRAELVKGERLAQIATEIGLDQWVRLGTGEQKAGGRQRPSILAGAFEALIGAVYLDSDHQRCEKVVLKLFAKLLANIEELAKQKDAKTALQEWLQAKKLALPEYTVLASAGKQHKQTFTVELKVTSLNQAVQAQGNSKKQAQQLAAEKMLKLLQNQTTSASNYSPK